MGEAEVILLEVAAVNELFYFQNLSLNVHSSLNLRGSSSSFDNHRCYQRYHELLGQKSASFIWCIEACINLNGTRVTGWNGQLKKLWERSKSSRKYLWNSSVFRNATGCNNFSKVSLHKKANSSRKFLNIFENIHFLCNAIELQ